MFACVVIMCAVPLCACDCGFCGFLCVGWLWSGLCFTVCGCVTVSPRASPPTRGSLPVMLIDMLGCGWVSVGVWGGESLCMYTSVCVHVHTCLCLMEGGLGCQCDSLPAGASECMTLYETDPE